ncbi:MAG: hypothetical protein AAF696_15270, partial [Bacteroidota bacterium]
MSTSTNLEQRNLRRYMKVFGYLFLLLLCSVQFAISQPSNPNITHYAYESYTNDLTERVPKQNYHAIQDDYGLLYVSTTDFIIMYDGCKWSNLTGSKALEKSVFAKSSRGKIYALSLNDFGFVDVDPLSNTYLYRSLKDYFGLAHKQTNLFSSILSYRDLILFHDTESLFIWNEEAKQLKHVKPPFQQITGLSIHGEGLYLTNEFGELFHYDFSNFNQLSEGESFASTKLQLFSYISDIWAYVNKEGFYRFEAGKWNKVEGNFSPWMKTVQFSQLLVLDDGNLALSTENNGFFLLDSGLNVVERISTERGKLSTNLINGIFQDKEKGIWLLLNDGMARWNYPSAIEQFSADFGLGTQVLSIVAWKGFLYVGLHGKELRYGVYKRDAEKPAKFMEVLFPEKVYDIWDLKVFQEKLFIASSRGLYVLNEPGGIPRRISAPEDIFALYRGKCDPNTLYIGWMTRNKNPTEFYLGRISIQNGELNTEMLWTKSTHMIRSIEEVECGEIWAGFFDLSKFVLDATRKRVLKVESRNLSKEKQDDHGSFQLFRYKDSLYFGSRRGINYFDEQADSLSPAKGFGEEFYKRTLSAYASIEDAKGGLWLSTVDNIQYLPAKSEEPQIWEINKFNSLPYVYYIYPENSDNVWFAGSDGLYRYRPNVSKAFDIP